MSTTRSYLKDADSLAAGRTRSAALRPPSSSVRRSPGAIRSSISRSKKWQRRQGLEGLPVDGEQVDRRRAAGGRRAHVVAEQRDLAEALPWPEPSERRLPRTGHALEHLDLAIDDDVEPVAVPALLEDDLARLGVFAPDPDRPGRPELHGVGRQNQVESPVDGNPDLPVQTGQLHPSCRAP
jgi:hypothetical protein